MKLAATLLLTLTAACTTTASPHAAPASAPVKPRPTTTVRVPATDPPSRQTTTTTTTEPTTTTTAPVHATSASPPVQAAIAPSPCGGWRDLIAAHFPAGQVAKACAVMLCESSGNPNAVSPTDDHGLFQINRRWNPTAPWDRIYDPAANTAYAAQLWAQRGWTAWSCA